MFGVLKIGKLGASMKRFNPRTLFAASEPGAWYDTSDLSTLFQDSAGTTPVTAVEQPVGLMLDLSGRGNHATQATTTKRPVLSRRVNLYPNSTFTGGVSGNPGTAPSGLTYFADANTTFTLSADTVRIETPAGYRAQVGTSYAAAANTEYRFRAKVNVRAATALWQHFTLQGPAGTTLRFFVDGVEVPGASTLPTGIHDLECRAALGVNAGAVLVRIGNGTQSTITFACDIEFTQPSFTLAADAHLPYQYVNTATDYDADPAKFPAYLRFDGVDDALQTGNIDFTGTDKMTVWAGIAKLSDAATGTVVELSASKNANNGVFALFAPLTSGALDISWYSNGTNERVASSTSESAPVTRVITGIGDISGDISRIRVNGAVVQTETADQGTGNYGNYPLYIGARAGTSLFFNGRLYPLIIRGAQSSLSQIEAGELYTKQKMRLP